MSRTKQVSEFCVYRVYDNSGCLLYVGATHDLSQRMTAHRGNKTWWVDVAEERTQLDWFDTPQEVAHAERTAIQTESPVWNRSGRNAPMIPYSERAAWRSSEIQPRLPRRTLSGDALIASVSAKLVARRPA